MPGKTDLTFVSIITTGPIPEDDDVVEVAAFRVSEDDARDEFHELADPDKLPVVIQEITGLTENDLAGCNGATKVLQELADWVGDGPIVVDDANKFAHFLETSHIHPPDDLLDSRRLARIVRPESTDFELTSVAEELDLEPPEFRRASDLVELTRDVWEALQGELVKLPGPTLDALYRIAAAASSPLVAILADAANRKEGFQLSDDRGLKLESVFRSHRELFSQAQHYEQPEPQDDELDTDKICAMFSPDGAVGRHLRDYEEREEQVEMTLEVCQAFNTPYHLMFEAGTGTGKSMAYLLPAIAWARQNEDKVVISTNTKNLQEQLFHKDLPFLRELLGGRFEAALLKGRGNYLCVRRFLRTVRYFDRELSEREQLEAMLPLIVWASRTESGDLAECRGLITSEAAFGLIPSVTSTGDECAGRACPYSDRCFVRRARCLAQLADVIVANHALVFADVGLDQPYLPLKRCVIFDEAHNIEDVATEAVAAGADSLSVFRITNRLWRARKDGSGSGMVATVMAIANKQLPEKGPLSRDTVIDLAQGVIESIDEAVDATRDCFGTMEAPFDSVPAHEEKILLEDCQPAVGIDGPTGEAAEKLNKKLHRLGGRIEDLAECLELNNEKMENANELARDLRAQVTRLHEVTDTLEFVLAQEEEDYVYWAERTRRRHQTFYSLHAAPLEIGTFMKGFFFDEMRTVILTSATMQVGGDFEYMRERLGGSSFRELELRCAGVGSPFDFDQQTLVAVPTFLPDAGGRRDQVYDAELSSFLIELLRATEGRGLVLFTSYSLLNNVYDRIKQPLERGGVPVLAQGRDGSREAITDIFRRVTDSVLLGTQSFWEGVDVTGEALSCLVLTKLPFHVFTEPLVQGRIEFLRQRGIDPFSHYTLPEAVISFRQGFGRLIRHRNDRGVIVVTDRRLVTKAYGRAFMQDLPTKPEVYKQKNGVIEDVRRFFGG
ncbi:MAG: helicase C-terminal domain-containing protein [Candidatus Brocadiia bacterium]